MSSQTATETCFCGAVQISFATDKENLVDTFICNCTDCRKLTASMFASNFIVKDKTLKYERGQDMTKKFAMQKTIETGNTMTNTFCSNCGSLMYRESSGFPGMIIGRIGMVDDLELQNTVFQPRIEQYVKDRSAWCVGGKDAEQWSGSYFPKGPGSHKL